MFKRVLKIIETIVYLSNQHFIGFYNKISHIANEENIIIIYDVLVDN